MVSLWNIHAIQIIPIKDVTWPRLFVNDAERNLFAELYNLEQLIQTKPHDEHINARPWCHGNMFYWKLPPAALLLTAHAPYYRRKMCNTNTNATPHPNPELTNRNLKCCWVAVCMKRNNCKLAQVTNKNNALRRTMKKACATVRGL